MRINEDYLDKVTADEMSDDEKVVDAEFDGVLSPDEWYEQAINSGFDTLIVLGTECSASEEITDDTRPKIIENIKRRMQRIMDNTCEHSPIQIVYGGYDAELEKQLVEYGIVFEWQVDEGGILPYDHENYGDLLFYKVCIKRTTVSRLLDLVGSLQSILHLSKGNPDYEYVYLYRQEDEHFVVIEDKDNECGICNYIRGDVLNWHLQKYQLKVRMGNVSQTIDGIANDLFAAEVFPEFLEVELQQKVREWITKKVKAAEKK